MNFPDALTYVSQLGAVRREKWPKEHALFLGTVQAVKIPNHAVGPNGAGVKFPPIIFRLGDDKHCAPFHPTQDDLLAGDWQEFEAEKRT